MASAVWLVLTVGPSSHHIHTRCLAPKVDFLLFVQFNKMNKRIIDIKSTLLLHDSVLGLFAAHLLENYTKEGKVPSFPPAQTGRWLAFVLEDNHYMREFETWKL